MVWGTRDKSYGRPAVLPASSMGVIRNSGGSRDSSSLVP